MTEIIKKYFKGDPIIWAVVVALSIVSLLAVYSSVSSLAYLYHGGNVGYYLAKHSILLAIGLIIIYTVHNIPYRFFSRLSQILLIISIPLLILTIFLGTNINDAARWLTLPGLGITFQTSDLAKLALIMYVSRLLAQKQIDDNEGKTFYKILIPIGIICLLIVPSNFSTSLLLFMACFILMFVGRVSTKYLLTLGVTLILVISLFFVLLFTVNIGGRTDTWKNRISSYISKDPQSNYQVNQSKIAIASGGIINLRPGKSQQRNVLPQASSDFIYAIIIEEYGLLGGIIILFLYLYLLFRAGVIVKKCRRTFPAFLVIGLTLLIVIQAMVNMAVAVNIFPVTGQPLPLVSMGGTSLLFNCIALGMILSVSREVEQQLGEEDNEQT